MTSCASERISNGLKVSGAKDTSSVYAIAQGKRSEISALSAMPSSLDRTLSIGEVALSSASHAVRSAIALDDYWTKDKIECAVSWVEIIPVGLRIRRR